MTQLWGPRHLGMEVDWAIQYRKFLTTKTGHTPEETMKYLLDLKKKGYKMVPCCDNFDKTKGCLGV